MGVGRIFSGGIFRVVMGHRNGLYSDKQRVYIGKKQNKRGLPVTTQKTLAMPMFPLLLSQAEVHKMETIGDLISFIFLMAMGYPSII